MEVEYWSLLIKLLNKKETAKVKKELIQKYKIAYLTKV